MSILHYDIPMSSEEEVTIRESSEISDREKLTSIKNNELVNNSAEKNNNGEDHSINIQKSLNIKTSNVLPLPTAKPINTCLSKTALQNGCYTVTFLDLMSLEVCPTYAKIKDNKSFDKLFKPGWLHEEVINSLYFNLTIKHTEALFCVSTEVMLITMASFVEICGKMMI